ncbi:MAG TPA: hypothetical protein VLN45_04350, partial [Ignavibacteriaceae bacterium]|nr:hypothetical protein [Ignavibacteriaceae bacterium]
VDGGFMNGSLISLFYDPLISKLISFGKDRNSAIIKMLRALREYHIAGLETNIHFLIELFQKKNIIEGKFDINYLEREYSNLHKEEKDISNTDIIAALFTAVLKNQSGLSQNVLKSSAQNSNKWLGQNDE